MLRRFSSRLLHTTAINPNGTGIHKIAVHIPQKYVSQEDLEIYDNVGQGKYTKGLGLRNMAFCDDNEDIHSVCLTALSKFLKKNNINPQDVGRLEVGTETLVDKSKAVKTVLTELFGSNRNIEGVDNVNACYGGTAALLNSAAWVDSPEWDGRYALVVCGDIATYESGPARPTGGAGIVCMLVGRNAPLQFEPQVRYSFFEHVYDFYKPSKVNSEWPIVDGHHSVQCYFRSLDSCYQGYKERFARLHKRQFSLDDDAKHIMFHTPFVKMGKKAFSRLILSEARENPTKYPSVDLSLSSKDLDAALDKAGDELFEKLVSGTQRMSSELGNSYTGSLYATLAGTIADNDCALKRLLLFSYGSGSASTLFSLLATKDVASVVDKEEIAASLAARVKVDPREFNLALERRQAVAESWTPVASPETLPKGTYYLSYIDKLHRRFYKINE